MSLESTNSHTKYRADIDGLRAIAILSVVGFHAFPYWIKGGYIGVDVFFVISGYLISTILFTSFEKNRFSFIDFYSGRIRRIFPALIAVLAASYFFGWIALFPDEYKQLGKHIASGSIFTSNITLLGEKGYFDSVAETKPLLHLWSLGIEEQFYIVWPIILWGAWKKKFNLIAITIVIMIASFLLNINKVQGDTVATFYSPQTRFWELLAGAFLARLHTKKIAFLSSLKSKIDGWLGRIIYEIPPEANGQTLFNVLSFAGLALISFGLFLLSKETVFPGWRAAIPVTGAALIISAGANAWLNRTILSSRPFVFFGLISYPLYLWHWPILSFARIIESDIPTRKIRVAAVLISIFFAWVTYRFIERPVRFGKPSNLKTITLIALMVTVGYMGFNSYKRDGLPFRENVKQAEMVNKEFSGTLWKYMQNEACLTKYPLEGTKGYGWWFCMASKKEDPTLLLIGSSYANDLYPGFINNSSFSKHSVLSIGTCDPAWIDESMFVQSKPGFDYSPCAGYRHRDQQKLINEIIEKSKSLKFVILNGLKNNPDYDYIERLKRRIDFIESKGAKVIIFLPRVAIDFDEHGRMLVDFDIKGCFARPYKNPKFGCEIEIDKINKAVIGFTPLVNEISKTHPNVKFFDQTELFCKNGNCSFIRNQMPLIRDIYGHMSEYGSTELSGIFEKWASINAPDIIYK
jgi:peptidoglycan/LPS O-acetylase OafA/YrhL